MIVARTTDMYAKFCINHLRVFIMFIFLENINPLSVCGNTVGPTVC